MVANKTTNLAGREMRLVSRGLSKTDVLALIKSLEASSADAFSKLKHLDALQELATRTVEAAREVADETRARITAEARASATIIVATGEERARDLIDESRHASDRVLKEAQGEAGRLQKKAMEAADAATKLLLKSAHKSADKVLADAIVIANGMLRDTKPNDGQTTSAHVSEQIPEGAVKPVPRMRGRHTIRWEPVPEATRYSLYIAEAPHDDEHIVFDSGDIEDTALSVPVELKEGVSYKWTIRAGNPDGWGPYAPLMELTV